MNLLSVLNGLAGVAVLVGIALACSNNRKAVNWRLVVSGLALQLLFAVVILKGPDLAVYFRPLGWPRLVFEKLSDAFVRVLSFAVEGAKFIFGNLAVAPGGEGTLGFYFAFQVLPTIIFFASLMSVLYYLGVMQRVVQAMAWIMLRVMGTSGAE